MRRVFFVAGIVVILLGIIGFLALLLQPVTAICVGISLILSGAMMLARKMAVGPSAPPMMAMAAAWAAVKRGSPPTSNSCPSPFAVTKAT